MSTTPNAVTAKLDRELDERRKANPDLTFAEFYAETVLDHVNQGEEHPTLGVNLTSGEDWRTGGLKRFRQFQTIAPTSSTTRLVDYGCGSLLIGQHFIRTLDPGHYAALDVVPDFFEIGKQLLGEATLAEKRPSFGVIGKATDEAKAAALGADVVISSAVAFHVHPDEMPTFKRNILACAGKPGCIVLFDAILGDHSFRYAHRGWAHPLDHYVELFPELAFVKAHNAKAIKRAGVPLTMAMLEFRRPQ